MVSRQDMIEESVETYLRDQLFTQRDYPTDQVVLLDSYPTNKRMAEPLDKNYIAAGFSFDDGGKQAELGAPTRRRLHTIDFHIFGQSRVWARNLAAVIRYSLESDGLIPLHSIPTGDVIDTLPVDYVSAQNSPVNNPRPWQENLWIVRLRVEDYYNPAGGG